MLPEPIASILRSGRAQYNARFAAARHRWPELDGDSFGFFLGSFVAPVVGLAETARPGSAVAVTEAAYDVALELVGQRLAGNQPRHPAMHSLWAQALGPLAAQIAAAPARVLPALHNAAHQLATTPGGRADEWIRLLAQLGPRAASADELLKLGQVLAWRAGLVHFRVGALAAADNLPEPLAVAAVGAADGSRWSELRALLAADRWFDPRIPRGAGTPPPLRPALVAHAGSFRGFDGLFLAPPRVAVVQERLLVRSGDEGWLLEADVFGATFHRATPAETAAFDPWVAPKPLPPEVARHPEIAGLGDVTSTAQVGRTLAVTGTLSHRVLLVAL